MQVRAEIVVLMDADKTTEVYIDVQAFSKAERYALAVKKFGLFCLVAVGCAFVPFLHFILVPLAIMGGAIAFFWQLGLTQKVLSGEFACPQCAQKSPCAVDEARSLNSISSLRLSVDRAY